MAETAKILNPSKTVLLPARVAGCSLAASITAEDVRQLKAKFPGANLKQASLSSISSGASPATTSRRRCHAQPVSPAERGDGTGRTLQRSSLPLRPLSC